MFVAREVTYGRSISDRPREVKLVAATSEYVTGTVRSVASREADGARRNGASNRRFQRCKIVPSLFDA